MLFKQATKILTLTALLTTLSFAQKEALLIGVDDYAGTDSDFGKGIKKDIDRMKALFEKWGFHTTVLYNKNSMRIEEYLNRYSSLKPNDSFIFYYSGHGSKTDDISGDEADGQDESIVLSDGQHNKYFLDDSMNGYLNDIKAKKLVLFDSCHSGTAFKKFGKGFMSKSMPSNKVDGVIQSKIFRPQQSVLKGGDYIVISASKDTELSLATTDGSMFTNAFYSQFANNQGLNMKLDEVRRRMESYIVKSCSIFSTPHHPQLSASNPRLKYSTMNDFIKSSQTVQPQRREPAKPQPIATKNISIMGQKTFKSGELLDFKIDTLGNTGYITVFSIENNTPFIMYQSQTPMKGVFNLKSFNIQPPIECYKACTNCASEKSVVFVAFSAKPVKISLNPATKTINAKIFSNTKAFQHQNMQMFKTIIKKFETTIY